ncbi:MAG: (d)CMP kinase [Phycisphaerae bacterium]
MHCECIIEHMIITIDGPAGSGKSTAARKLAARLEIAYLDTGAMYRAVAYAAMQRNVTPSDSAALCALAAAIRLEVDCGPTHTRVRVDGHDVSEAIRTMEVSRNTSHVARCQEIRDMLVRHQRRIGAKLGSFVSEGRDQGTVAFPTADSKFVLEASLAKRAERRYQELVADGQDVDIASVTESLQIRDSVDAKQWEPLVVQREAIVLDTTHLSIQNVVDRMVELIHGSGRSGQ